MLPCSVSICLGSVSPYKVALHRSPSEHGSTERLILYDVTLSIFFCQPNTMVLAISE